MDRVFGFKEMNEVKIENSVWSRLDNIKFWKKETRTWDMIIKKKITTCPFVS